MGFNELITAAQTGDAYAQFELGSSYYYGNGTPIDKMKAVEWWKKAAEQGHVHAQFELAIHYNGHSSAQIVLGLHYYQGKGVPKSKEKAIEWWRRVLEKGNTEDERMLKNVFNII